MVSVSHGHSIHTRGTSCNLCISNKISSGKNIAQSLLWSFSLPWLITFWEVPLQPGGKNSQIGFISTYIRSQVLHFLPLLPNNYKWVKKKKITQRPVIWHELQDVQWAYVTWNGVTAVAVFQSLRRSAVLPFTSLKICCYDDFGWYPTKMWCYIRPIWFWLVFLLFVFSTCPLYICCNWEETLKCTSLA